MSSRVCHPSVPRSLIATGTSLISPSTGGLCVVSEAGPGAPTCCMKKSLAPVWLDLVINSRHKRHLASGKAISAARGMITAARSSY